MMELDQRIKWNEQMKEYRKNHKQQLNSWRKQYYIKNKEKISEQRTTNRLKIKLLKAHQCSECSKIIYSDLKVCRSCSKKNERNPMWSGDSVQRIALHDWVRRRKPKPTFCEECGKQPPKDLANITGKMIRDINNFKWMCRHCHQHYDSVMGIRKPVNIRKEYDGCFKCNWCGRLLPKEKFKPFKRNKNGYWSRCMECPQYGKEK